MRCRRRTISKSSRNSAVALAGCVDNVSEPRTGRRGHFAPSERGSCRRWSSNRIALAAEADRCTAKRDHAVGNSGLHDVAVPVEASVARLDAIRHSAARRIRLQWSNRRHRAAPDRCARAFRIGQILDSRQWARTRSCPQAMRQARTLRSRLAQRVGDGDVRAHTPPRGLLHDRPEIVSHQKAKTPTKLLNYFRFAASHQGLLCGRERFLEHDHYGIVAGDVCARSGWPSPVQMCVEGGQPVADPQLNVRIRHRLHRRPDRRTSKSMPSYSDNSTVDVKRCERHTGDHRLQAHSLMLLIGSQPVISVTTPTVSPAAPSGRPLERAPRLDL